MEQFDDGNVASSTIPSSSLNANDPSEYETMEMNSQANAKGSELEKEVKEEEEEEEVREANGGEKAGHMKRIHEQQGEVERMVDEEGSDIFNQSDQNEQNEQNEESNSETSEHENQEVEEQTNESSTTEIHQEDDTQDSIHQQQSIDISTTRSIKPSSLALLNGTYTRRPRKKTKRSVYNDIYLNTKNPYKQARAGEWTFLQPHRIKYFEGSHEDLVKRNRSELPVVTEYDFTVISQTTYGSLFLAYS